jgi:tRNA-uridine 2-sulfurtransferase
VETVAVALSGGVDSALSAYLLKKEGYSVRGLHADFGLTDPSPLPWLEKIISFLKIPLEIVSCRSTFQEEVIGYFASEYGLGRTPNPCVVCNPLIKFGFLAEKAFTMGADFFATGHYARIVPSPWKDGLTIARGADQGKDQSYFLHRLEARILSRVLFPLGDWTKARTKQFASEIGLPQNPQGESQDICFLPKGGYREFLLRHKSRDLNLPGDIIDLTGKKLGTHQGLYAYTVGQRRGLGLPAAEPYYVIRLERGENRVVIGTKKDLESPGCRVSGVHFLCRPLEIREIEVLVQVRYRHKPAPAILEERGDNHWFVRFENPQSAVTPGQAAVFYHRDVLLGGGWIEEAG